MEKATAKEKEWKRNSQRKRNSRRGGRVIKSRKRNEEICGKSVKRK